MVGGKRTRTRATSRSSSGSKEASIENLKRLGWAFGIGAGAALVPVLEAGGSFTWAVVGGVVGAGLKAVLIVAPKVVNH